MHNEGHLAQCNDILYDTTRANANEDYITKTYFLYCNRQGRRDNCELSAWQLTFLNENGTTYNVYLYEIL